MSQTAPDRESRYLNELRNMPASGGGGCHTSLLRIANLGRIASLTPEQVARDLASHVHGTRKVSGREISDAVRKAFNTAPAIVPKPAPVVVDGPAALERILKRGEGADEAALWELSQVRLDWPPEEDAVQILSRLYRPEDRLFIGSRFESGAEHVLSVAEWIAKFERGAAIPEHICPNPFTGEHNQTKDGKLSYRADSCVAQFKFAVVEFDLMPREQQFQFWAGVAMPVTALLDSGGKSLHGWIRIDAANEAEWQERVEWKLFGILTRMGADPMCRNESRLSRMAGHFRKEKQNFQRILYLNPDGKKAVLP